MISRRGLVRLLLTALLCCMLVCLPLPAQSRGQRAGYRPGGGSHAKTKKAPATKHPTHAAQKEKQH